MLDRPAVDFILSTNCTQLTPRVAYDVALYYVVRNIMCSLTGLRLYSLHYFNAQYVVGLGSVRVCRYNIVLSRTWNLAKEGLPAVGNPGRS